MALAEILNCTPYQAELLAAYLSGFVPFLIGNAIADLIDYFCFKN